VVIIEPDALALLDLLPRERQSERLELLRAASMWFARVPGVSAYLDAGHSGWVPPDEMIRRLSEAGVGSARGFSLNVSNFGSTADEVRYGDQVAPMIGWKHFVVDTSRNGNGSDPVSAWCNPPGRALGPAPQTVRSGQVDGFLWIKPPGESDGSCGSGQPPAGTFWPQYADDLARAAGW
jgi:endoglucanase